MTRPILQYRPLDRGFLLCLHGRGFGLRTGSGPCAPCPGNLHGRDRLTPARARVFLPDGRLVETHTVPLRWQRALPWLASMATDPERVGGSLAFWGVGPAPAPVPGLRGALLPQLDTRGNPWRATWGISLTSPADRDGHGPPAEVHAALGAGLPRGRRLDLHQGPGPGHPGHRGAGRRPGHAAQRAAGAARLPGGRRRFPGALRGRIPAPGRGPQARPDPPPARAQARPPALGRPADGGPQPPHERIPDHRHHRAHPGRAARAVERRRPGPVDPPQPQAGGAAGAAGQGRHPGGRPPLRRRLDPARGPGDPGGRHHPGGAPVGGLHRTGGAGGAQGAAARPGPRGAVLPGPAGHAVRQAARGPDPQPHRSLGVPHPGRRPAQGGRLPGAHPRSPGRIRRRAPAARQGAPRRAPAGGKRGPGGARKAWTDRSPPTGP